MFASHLNCSISRAQVTTKKAQEGRPQTTTDVRSLSGGERSFSTVCFVLALWDVADSPFRMLDEFDVFMVSLESPQHFSISHDFTFSYM